MNLLKALLKRFQVSPWICAMGYILTKPCGSRYRPTFPTPGHMDLMSNIIQTIIEMIYYYCYY